MKAEYRDKVKKVIEDVDCQRISPEDALKAIEKIVDDNTADCVCGVGDLLSKYIGGKNW